MFNRLNSLQLSRTDWKIKIRVTRAWDSFSSSHEFIGMNLIIIDEEDFHIHGFVIPEALEALDHPFYEGGMYIIENFMTRAAIGTLRPVTSDVCIILNESSIVTNIPLEIVRFPRYKFEITEIGDIYSVARNLDPGQPPVYALDIVGIILDKGETVVEATTPGMRQSIRFNLYDGRNMIRVVLNDEKVTLLGHIFDGDYPVDPIVILTSMRPHFRNGVLQVSSTEATKVYANIRYHVVWQIRQRIMFNSLRSLELSKTDWKIKIRVTRTWNSFSTNRELIGMNMILIDIEDYHIHAFVVAEACASLGSYFFEGNMYIIENFATRRSIGYLRPVTSAMCIILNQSTSVTPVPLELGLIARHKFEITELGDVYSIIRNLAPDQFSLKYIKAATDRFDIPVDVLGVMLDIGDVKVEDSAATPTTCVRFNLYDGRNMTRVVCSGEIVQSLLPILEGDFQTNPIVILSSMKPHFHKGVLQLSSISASKAYINISYDAVSQMRRRLIDQC
ncbi:hypothetical protein DCAR_0312284 [Daucus carota subsp. sativus]|uniref:Replication protein A 70 kDa DNA-binding subunit B/D first OB fold domain-containing protein n=1 Tax=Daucus carota subsp. sativus TaxID=79200 RepID=A0A166AXB3_DAUCS|nr:hypothetical protein DCAR_0312284 [Daucus carota subsp. sativus]